MLSETIETASLVDTPAVEHVEAGKAAQRRRWDEAAESLRAWFPTFETFMAPVTEAMVVHADQPGARVVDVASGFGEPALTLARRVGTGGSIVATDLSPAMLAVAAERARALGLAHVEFAEMDAEEPTLAPSSYDAVMCRLGLMLLPRLDLALERLGALLVPGGRLVAAVWGRHEANPCITLAMRILAEFLELVPQPGVPGLFDLGADGVLEDALTRSGLRDVEATRMTLQFSWSSPEAFVAFQKASPLRRLVADEEPIRQAQAWRELLAVATRISGGGPFQLAGEVLVVVGRRR